MAGVEALGADVGVQIADLGPQPPGKGDPKVEASFALGWHMAELQLLESDPPGAQASGRLPSLALLSADQKFTLLLGQIGAGIRALGANGAASTAAIDQAQSGAAPVSGGPGPQPYLTQAALDVLRKVHVDLLTQLTIQDFRLGKAYSLGAEMSGSMLAAYKACKDTADPTETVAASFDARTVDRMIREIRDLKSVFQPYAADAVLATVDDWGKWIRVIESDAQAQASALPGGWSAMADDNLYPQIIDWRSLLSGERLSTDVLHVGDYVSALQRLLSRYWMLVRAFVFRWSALLVLVPMVLFVGLGLYLLVKQQFAAAYAAVVAFLGLTGISGVSVTAAVKNALQKTEDDLWETELGASVAIAIDHVPAEVSGSHVKGLMDPRTTQSRGGRRRRAQLR